MGRKRPRQHKRSGGIDPRTGKRRADSVVNPDVAPAPPPASTSTGASRDAVAQLAVNHPSNPDWEPAPDPEPTPQWPASVRGFDHLPAVRDMFDAEIVVEAAARQFADVVGNDPSKSKLTPDVIFAAINITTAEHNNDPDHDFSRDLATVLAAQDATGTPSPRRIVVAAAAAYQDHLLVGRTALIETGTHTADSVFDSNLSAALAAYQGYDPETGNGPQSLQLDHRRLGANQSVAAEALIDAVGDAAFSDAGAVDVERHPAGIRVSLENGYIVEMVQRDDYDPVNGHPIFESEVRRVHIDDDGTRTVVAAIPFYPGEERERFLQAADPNRRLRQNGRM